MARTDTAAHRVALHLARTPYMTTAIRRKLPEAVARGYLTLDPEGRAVRGTDRRSTRRTTPERRTKRGLCTVANTDVPKTLADRQEGTPTHRVTRDYVEQYRGTEDGCWVYVLKAQSMSVDWAMKYEGWDIAPLTAS